MFKMCIFIFIFIISYIYLFFTYILLYSCKLLLVQLAHKNFTHMQHDNKSDLISVIIVYSLCHNVFQVLNISNQFVVVGFFCCFYVEACSASALRETSSVKQGRSHVSEEQTELWQLVRLPLCQSYMKLKFISDSLFDV